MAVRLLLVQWIGAYDSVTSEYDEDSTNLSLVHTFAKLK